MAISSELLKDFIDGKLAGDEASRIAAQIANDPDLAAYVEDQRALKAALESPAILWLERVRERIATKSASWSLALVMATGIGLGVLLAGSFGIATDLRSQDGALIAQGELAHVLSTSLAAEPGKTGMAAGVAASFWSKNGSFCRIFVTRGNAESALAGIACRERGAWRIAAMATMAPGNTPQLPLAALPASVRGVMDNLIVGQPLDLSAERQARNQDWRVR
jgi:hypothetical protein